MTDRRDYGTGSIYQRADGRWIASISQGWTERGTRRRITVTAPGCEGGCKPRCHHRAEIKRRLRKKEQALEQGAGEASTRTTVKAWADEWLPIAERDLRPSAMNATRSAVTRWVIPTIGHRRLADLAPPDVRAVLDAQRRAGRSSSTQRRTHSVLMSLLKAAQAEGHPVAPRVLAVKAPEKAASDRDAIPTEAAARMMLHAADDPAGCRWLVAFLQGLRQGEALGLTWDAVDLDRGALTVSWQLQPLPYRIARDRTSGYRVPDGHESRQVRGRWHLVRPKSSAGWRVVPIVAPLDTALAKWREQAPDAPHGLVWHHPVGDPPKRDDRAWYALQDAADVRHPSGRHYTIHEARHSTATLLLEAGVDPAVITAILGHSSIVTSRGYMHVRTAPLADALGKVAARLQLG